MFWFRIIKKRRRRRSNFGTKNFNKYRKQARGLVLSRLEYFNKFYGFKYGRVAIRNQRTRWGSCSSKNNLNFNYRLALIPPALADYVIVHELCHLKEMNHSRAFWNLVAQVLPQCRQLKRELRKISL